MKRALGLLLFLPAMAMAQTPDTEVKSLPGTYSLCLIEYPAEALRKGLMGSATALVRVTPEGTTSGVIIAATSGNEILDRATAACAKTWHLAPATHDGKAIDAPLSKSVEWLISSPTWRVAMKLREPLMLCLSAKEAAGHRFGWGKPITTVAYTLKDGEVLNATVKRSSGDAELDQKAVACVAGWHFEPQTVDPDTTVTGTLVQGPNPPKDIPSFKERSQAALTPRAVTGPGLATFDWREFGAE